MFDKSDGFFRRQLVLTTKDKNAERIDDPHIADKMRAEIEGIFLWAFEGLQRLLANNFQFTESDRAISNREAVKRNNVNAVEFMESDGYFVFAEDKSVTSKELYEIYKLWCEEIALSPMSSRSLSDFLMRKEKQSMLIRQKAARSHYGMAKVEMLIRKLYSESKEHYKKMLYIHTFKKMQLKF